MRATKAQVQVTGPGGFKGTIVVSYRPSGVVLLDCPAIPMAVAQAILASGHWPVHGGTAGWRWGKVQQEVAK